MNCYLLTNPAEEYQLNILAYFKKLEKSKVKPQVVKSEQEFGQESFKGAFRNPSDTDSVFVVPELNWSGEFSVSYGYKKAIELMDTKLKDKTFFNLVFISMFTRDQLLSLVGAEHKEMVKAFPHLCLLDLLNENVPALPRSCTKVHFEMLKRLVISKSGRLDYLKHQVYHIADKDLPDVPQLVEEILDILALPEYGGNTDSGIRVISSLRYQAGRVKEKSDVIKLASDIRSHIDTVKESFQAPADNRKKFFKVLIVEDDPGYRCLLVSFFKQFFYSVTALEDEAIVRAEDEIRKAAGNYDVVVLDLMYSTNGKDKDILPFNGLDLYNMLREEEISKSIEAYEQGKGAVHRAAARIVTAVPRNDIKSFDAKAPRIFTKGNGWDQLAACMADRMDELLEECKENYRTYLMGQPHCPKKGLFTKPGMYETIKAQVNKDKYTEAVDYARSVESGEIMTDYSLPSPGEDQPSVFLGRLKAILAHRRLVIKYISEHDGIFQAEDFAEYIKQFLPDKADPGIDRNYLTTKLGFSATTQIDPTKKSKLKASGDLYEIPMDDPSYFFDEELDLFDASPASFSNVDKWIQMLKTFFADKTKDEYLEFCACDYAGDPICPDFRGALKKSGIWDFAGQDGKATSNSLLEFLMKANKYLKTRGHSMADREWIWGLFEDETINPEELSLEGGALPGLYQELLCNFKQISSLFFDITGWISDSHSIFHI